VIRHWNQENPNVKMFYSTPTRYLSELKKLNGHYKEENAQLIQNLEEELMQKVQNGEETAGTLAQNRKPKVKQTDSQHEPKKEKGIQTSAGFSVRRDDSFPYAQKPNKYWSGYYTTRPHFKKLLRTTSARFHSSLAQSSLQVLKLNNPEYASYVVEQQQLIMEKLGTLQHHDAISGTGVRAVSEDYYVKATDALRDVESMNSRILQHDFNKFGLEIKRLDQSIMLR
jgi:hypothetical protein